MGIHENLTSELTVIDSTEIDGEITVIDEETGEEGTVIAQTYDGKLTVEWQDADESDNHDEIELISVYAPNVKLILQEETSETEYVQNPFFSGWRKRRKAGKSLSKRLKAESNLEKAKKREEEAIKRAKENPAPRHRRFAK